MALFSSSNIGTALNADYYGSSNMGTALKAHNYGAQAADQPAPRYRLGARELRPDVDALVLELKRAEEGLRAKAEQIRMLCHDVRSPLSAIRMIAFVLAQDENAPDRQRQLDVLDRATNTILALVDQVLDFERLDDGQMQLEAKRLDPRALLATTVEQLEMPAREKGVELTLQIDDAVPATIQADPVKLGQIMCNLTGNAVKFTSRGAVTVAARMRSVNGRTELELSVEDSGIGIAPDRVPAIFDTFIQANATIDRRYGGSGLGLSICRRLVALHGGALEVRSAPGAGSRFWFTLDPEGEDKTNT